MKITEEWRKSTFSGGDSACVEVRRNGDRIEVRHSKDQAGPVLSFTEGEWAAFRSGMLDNEFDL